jgi:hypothetical protein
MNPKAVPEKVVIAFGPFILEEILMQIEEERGPREKSCLHDTITQLGTECPSNPGIFEGRASAQTTRTEPGFLNVCAANRRL